MTSSSAFAPLNALEQALLDTQEGRMLPAAFFEQLTGGTVFILLDKAIPEGGSWTSDTSLLVLNSQSGFPVIALFTAPERSIAWLAQAPAYPHGLQISFRWLLQGISAGVGLVLNPGSAVGVELPPSLVDKLRASAGVTGARADS